MWGWEQTLAWEERTLLAQNVYLGEPGGMGERSVPLGHVAEGQIGAVKGRVTLLPRERHGGGLLLNGETEPPRRGVGGAPL